MKRFNKKSGFTLVECVVAMAILAVMTLFLAMMMQIIVNLRNYNTKMEKDIDEQANHIVNADGVVEQELTGDDGKIDFGDGVYIPGGNKIYFDDPESNAQVGGLQYDIGNIPTPGGSSGDSGGEDGDEDTDDDSEDDQPKGYGAAKVKDNTITAQEASTSDKTGDIYHIKWTFSFTPVEFDNEMGIKIALPASAIKIEDGFSGNSWEKIYKFHVLGNNVVRFQIINVDNTYKTVEVLFDIPKEEYEKFGSIAGYFQDMKIENANTVTIKLP